MRRMEPLREYRLEFLALPGKGSVQSRKRESKDRIRKSMPSAKMLPEGEFFIKIEFVGNFSPSQSYSGTYDLDDMIETVVGALSKLVIPDDKYIVKIEAEKKEDKSFAPGEGYTQIQVYRG